MDNTRSQYLDIVKGAAMLLVFLGHSVQWAEADFMESPLFHFIYSFHMPVFMLVSGWLFYRVAMRKEPALPLLWHRVRALLITISTFSLLAVVPRKRMIHDIEHCDGLSIISSYLNLWGGEFLWFLWSVIICSAVVLLCVRLTDKFFPYTTTAGNAKAGSAFQKVAVYGMMTAVVIFMLLLPDAILRPVHKFMLPYFIIGYAARDWNFDRMIQKHAQLLVALSLPAYVVLMQFYGKYTLIYLGFEGSGRIYQNLLRYAVGLVGSVSFLYAIKIMTGRCDRVDSLMARVGRMSLGLYAFQIFYIYFLSRLPLPTSSVFVNTSGFFILIFALSYNSVIFCQTHLWAGRIMLGMQNQAGPRTKEEKQKLRKI